jgi:hypothetical protein
LAAECVSHYLSLVFDPAAILATVKVPTEACGTIAYITVNTLEKIIGLMATV